MSQWYITQTERKATLTDFSLASKSFYNINNNAGYHYLRSIGSSSNVCHVDDYGYVYSSYFTAFSGSGVRPAFVNESMVYNTNRKESNPNRL